jgi:hypothetical protein
MYAAIDHEASRQHRQEIKQEVATYRLQNALRGSRAGKFRLLGDTKWELGRYVGLLRKRLRNVG